MKDTDLQISSSPTTASASRPLGSLFTRIKIGAAGEHLPDDASEFAAVFFPQLGVMVGAGSRGINGRLAKEGDKKGSPAQLTAACKALDLAGFTDWTLADDVQSSLPIDRNCNPCIDTDYFRDVVPDWHWTSKPTPWSAAASFGVNFVDGYVLDYLLGSNRGFGLPVRVVGQ